jgi:hypothetical protein
MVDLARSAGRLRDCIACNKEHNVPTFADETDPKRHEIMDPGPYHNASRQRAGAARDLEHKQVTVPVTTA